VTLCSPPQAFGRGLQTVSGAKVAAALRAGRRVVLPPVRVIGPVDLTAADVIARPFKCRSCVFTGPVDASDVTFARTVDLSGSTFARQVSFHGTTFAAPILLGTTSDEPHATFRRGVDFSLAVFDDLFSADHAQFASVTQFAGARFRGDSSFVGVQLGPTNFSEASFGAAALFRQTIFGSAVNFTDTNFEGRTDFTEAQFKHGVDFIGTQFAKGGTFLGANFKVPYRDAPAANFQSATSGGDLSFTFAKFVTPFASKSGEKELGDIAIFSNLVCGGALTFHSTMFASAYSIDMTQLQTRDISLDVSDVAQVDGEDNQRAVLKEIESSAKNHGDLAQANDADYRLRVLASRHYGPVGHAFDFVFYRGVAGYFVRPLRPVIALVALVAIFAVARVLRQRAAPPIAAKQRRRGRTVMRNLLGWTGRLAHSVLDTFALIVPRRGDERTSAALGPRLEAFVYRVLLVCTLLGLANSNPTLRQMVDSLL
jgi:uncharacterized protein YjbI with pentapeptide repeats